MIEKYILISFSCNGDIRPELLPSGNSKGGKIRPRNTVLSPKCTALWKTLVKSHVPCRGFWWDYYNMFFAVCQVEFLDSQLLCLFILRMFVSTKVPKTPTQKDGMARLSFFLCATWSFWPLMGSELDLYQLILQCSQSPPAFPLSPWRLNSSHLA